MCMDRIVTTTITMLRRNRIGVLNPNWDAMIRATAAAAASTRSAMVPAIN